MDLPYLVRFLIKNGRDRGRFVGSFNSFSGFCGGTPLINWGLSKGYGSRG